MLASNNEFPSVLFAEQAADVATPGAGDWRAFFKADGLYVINDAGQVVGPLDKAVLATTTYQPGSNTTLQTTSATFVDVDATHLTVTFTAPPTGNVLVTLEAVANVGNAAAAIYWGLADGSGDITNANTHITAVTTLLRVRATFKIIGLTPGTSYTYRWRQRSSSASYAVNTTCGGVWGAATMEVRAA